MLQASRPDNSRTTTGPNSATAPGWWVLAGITLCFALSGFAALLYQTAWTRQFSLVFGTSELAVATVLAAYMAGLALGAWLIERFLPRISGPIFVYGLLEFAIAAGAIAVPFLLMAADKLMVLAIGANAEPPDSLGGWQSVFYVLTAFVVLAVPTACMGATLPLLTRHLVSTPAQIGRRVGFLYTINTLGAAGGALCAAYLILPALGLTGTVFVGVFVNVIVFALATAISRISKPRRPPPSWEDASPHSRSETRQPLSTLIMRGRQWILPLMLISGAASFIYEVLWTRMLSHILGGSIFAFATMVASFLLGIAAGSAVASRVARSLGISISAFVVCQAATAFASIAIYLGIDALVPQHAGLAGNTGIAMAVLLPATFFIGATFPLAVRILVDEPERAAVASARVYAWNTVGAIAGALLAGFVLIPALKFEGTIYLTVLVNLSLAMLTLLLVVRAPFTYSAAALAALVTVATLFRPQPPVKLLRTSPLNVATAGALRYYGVGRSASVVALEQNGMLVLRTNGLPEAMMEMSGSVPRFSGEFWLSSLAVLARPEMKSILVVGYGGGVVIDGVPPSVESVDVIELEPEVIEANRVLRSVRKRDPLADPRVHIVLNDARGALALTDKRYDAVVSQPSHPWTAGASHLYTREFMQQVAAHLNPEGVFIQWMNISFLDEALLRSLSATLLDVFKELRIYRPDPNTLVFLASGGALRTEEDVARTRATIATAQSHYARYGIEVPEDLLVALSADQQGAVALARGADLITDDRNRLATDTVYDRGGGFVPTTLSHVLESYDPLQRRGSWIYAAGSQFSFPYMARRLAQFISTDPSHADRILRMSRLIPDPSTAAYVESVARSSRGDVNGARRLLSESLGIDPSNQDARFELIRSSLAQLSHDTAPADIAAEAAQLPSVPAALLQAGRHAVREEWEALPGLDKVLAQSRWTDPWHPECVQMRANWRLRVTNPEHRGRLGRDALLLLEELVLTQPSTVTLSLRARAAIAINRPDILLESINGYAESVGAMVNYFARADLPGVRGTLESLNNDLGAMRTNPQVEAARVDEVRTKLLNVRDAILSRVTTDDPS